MARTDNEDINAFNTRFQSGRFSHSRKTVIGDTFITLNGSLVNFINGGVADRNVYLPVLEKGRFYVVGNIGTTNSLIVRDSLGFLKTTLLPNDTALLFASEGEWLALRGWAALGIFTNTVNGLVPAPNSITPGSLFLRDDGQWGQVQVTGIVDAFKFITDGTNTAIGAGPDTFRIRSSTSKIGITVTNNEAVFGDNVNLTVLEGAVDHNALLNFVANKHIDHTSVTLTAGLGISGGGDIATSRTFDFAPSELTTTAGPVLTDFAVMDLAAGGPRRTLFSAVNAILNHNNLLNYVANQHIDHTGVSIVAGSGLSGGGTIAASRTLTLDINGLAADTLATGDFFAFFDISGVDNNKITFANLNASIDHNALLNYVANQHIDHSAVSVSTTEGIQGGGTIAATRTHKLDISGLTADATPDPLADYVVTWDNSASLHKKVLITNLPSSGFNITALVTDTIVGADEIPFFDVSGSDTNKTTLTNFMLASGAALKVNNLTDLSSVNAALSNIGGVSTQFAQGWSAGEISQGLKNLGNVSSLVDAKIVMGTGADITSGDVNNLITDGFYMVEAACTNQPVASVQYYMLVQKYPPAGGAVQQTAWDVTAAGGMWNRTLLTTWGPWRQVGRPAHGQLWGLTMSTAGASTTMTIAAGEAVDNIQAVPYLMILGSAISKTTSAWAVGSGNGGIDTGSVAANTWYHWYLIARGDTGVVDAIFSLSASNPAYPSGYSFARRIGSMRTNGSSQWETFKQFEDTFYLQTPSNDGGTQPGTTDTLYTLHVPTGIRVKPMFILSGGISTSAESGAHVRSPDLQATETGVVSTSGNAIGITTNVARYGMATNMDLWTDTSARINIIASVAQTVWILHTYGWIDTRGRLS